MIIHVRVIPRASQNAIQGELGDALKIRLQAPPVDGKANAALLAFLAEKLDVTESRLQLLHGSTGRNKTILLAGFDLAEVRGKLLPSKPI